MSWDLFLQLEFILLTVTIGASIIKATVPGRPKSDGEK